MTEEEIDAKLAEIKKFRSTLIAEIKDRVEAFAVEQNITPLTRDEDFNLIATFFIDAGSPN